MGGCDRSVGVEQVQWASGSIKGCGRLLILRLGEAARVMHLGWGCFETAADVGASANLCEARPDVWCRLQQLSDVPFAGGTVLLRILLAFLPDDLDM